MKLKNLVSKRYKEMPADCQIASQALMMRGGYIKPVANGIYTLFICRGAFDIAKIFPNLVICFG